MSPPSSCPPRPTPARSLPPRGRAGEPHPHRSGGAPRPLRWGIAAALVLLLAGLPGLGWGRDALSPLAAAPAPAPATAARIGIGAQPPATPPARPAAPSAWVMLEGRRVLEIRSAAGAQTLEGAARRASAELQQLAANFAIAPDRLVVREDPPYSMVGLLGPDGSFRPRLAVDDRAAHAFGTTRQLLAESYRDQLRGAIRQYRSSHALGSWLRGTALALLVLGAYLLWVRGQVALEHLLSHAIHRGRHPWLTGLRLGSSRVLDAEQVRGTALLLLRGVHWALLLLASYLLIPLLLGLFPPTQGIAEGLRSHILRVGGGVVDGVVGAIPNLLTIALILLLTRLAMQASHAWFLSIDRGRLQIPGFYREWARPTGRLAGAAILLAGLVIAYPYVPGSGSRAFQGAGLFVGLLAALGSSAVASNVISGLMLIYTRAFQEGDRVSINDVVGVVQDRDLLVTRIQTPRNELVSIPNATVIGSPILNYSFGRREIHCPVALATSITLGYDVPWRRVHELLLGAAADVPAIVSDPAPYVLQTSLNDFHISYELNAAIGDVSLYRETLSALLAAIQDRFAAANVEILSPAYHAIRNGNPSTVPRFTPPQG